MRPTIGPLTANTESGNNDNDGHRRYLRPRTMTTTAWWDATDNCPLVANRQSGANSDHDEVSVDSCDNDNDHDGIPTGTDNCSVVANPGQADNDHDGSRRLRFR